jgi:rSAM/selenodomain-associated transferase 1
MIPALLVLAKQPVAGRVKTRLCPPCTPEQAAAVAEAALLDTMDVVRRTPAPHRTLVVHGHYGAPTGWHVVPQRGEGLAQRIAHAFVDAGSALHGTLLVGMDTPQLTASLLGDLGVALDDADAVLAPASDGGWWALGLRDPRHAEVLAGVPMSTDQTGHATVAALRARRLRVAIGPCLRDVDTAADAIAVAALARGERFRQAVAHHVPIGAVA